MRRGRQRVEDLLEGHEANKKDKIEKLGGPEIPSGSQGSPSRGAGDDDEVGSQNSDVDNYGTAQKLVSGDSGFIDPRDQRINQSQSQLQNRPSQNASGFGSKKLSGSKHGSKASLGGGSSKGSRGLGMAGQNILSKTPSRAHDFSQEEQIQYGANRSQQQIETVNQTTVTKTIINTSSQKNLGGGRGSQHQSSGKVSRQSQGIPPPPQRQRTNSINEPVSRTSTNKKNEDFTIHKAQAPERSAFDMGPPRFLPNADVDDKDSFQDGSDGADIPPIDSGDIKGRNAGTFKTDNPFNLGTDQDSDDLSNENDTDDEADRSFSYHGSREDKYSDEDIDEEALEQQDAEDNQPIRVYDARFKIPRNTNLVEVEKNFEKQTKDLHRGKTKKVCGCTYTAKTCIGRLCMGGAACADTKEVMCFKKTAHAATILLMALTMGLTIFLMIRNVVVLHTNGYFVARARYDVKETIDFENITTTKVLYFLYQNETQGASDIHSENKYLIVENVNDTCEGSGYQLEESLNRAMQIRDNIKSPYMFVSEAYCILLMIATFVAACIYVPFFMKEYDIPIILRKAGSNIFYDLLMIRIYVYMAFMTLSGALPHLTMFFLNDKCLHTTDQDFFGINWADYYQYCITVMVWTMSIPILVYMVASIFKDNFRYFATPFLVANVVFGFCTLLLGFIVVAFTIIEGNSFEMQMANLLNVGVFITAVTIAQVYEHYYAKRDLLRTDEADDSK